MMGYKADTYIVVRRTYYRPLTISNTVFHAMVKK